MKKGFVLFAEPTVQHDLTFSRSVILIVEQNENGIVGFIINKKTYIPLSTKNEIKAKKILGLGINNERVSYCFFSLRYAK